MADDLGGGLFLVTEDDDITLDEGPVGQVIHDAAPDVLLTTTETVSTLVEDVTELQIVESEQVILLLADPAPEPDFVTEIVWGGPKGDPGPAGADGAQGPQGEPGPQNLFIQADAPVTGEETYLWVQTGLGDGSGMTFWIEDGQP